MSSRVPIDRERLAVFCQRHPILKLSLFGSVLRDDFDPSRSDIDVLVEFQPESRVTMLKMVELEWELTEILGRKVDLRTPGELSRYFRQRVLETAEVQFLAG